MGDDHISDAELGSSPPGGETRTERGRQPCFGAPGTRDLFRALLPHVKGREPIALCLVGPEGAGDSGNLARELAAVTASETGHPVLVVRFSPSTSAEWPLHVVEHAGAEPVLFGHVSTTRCSSVQTMRTALAAALPRIDPGTGGYVLLHVTQGEGVKGTGTEPKHLGQLLNSAKGPFQIVLADLRAAAAAMSRYMDGAVLVVGPDATVDQASNARWRVVTSGGTVIGVVIDAGQPLRVPLPAGRSWLQLGRVAALLFAALVSFVGIARIRQTARSAVAPRQDLPTVRPSSPPPASSGQDALPMVGRDDPPVVAPTTMSDARPAEQAAVRPTLDRSTREVRELREPADETDTARVSRRVAREPINRAPPPSQESLSGTSNPESVETRGRSDEATPPSSEPPLTSPASQEIAFAGVGGVTKPERLAEFAVTPRYKALAAFGPVEATVLLSAVVKTDGTVNDVRRLESRGAPPDAVKAAIEAVTQWRYRPATKDGRPVDARITVLVDFRTSS